jgi:7-cyano-7-deazaguanine synthase in queuosine biosynthesis
MSQGICVLFSGGIDSTVVAHMAKLTGNLRLLVFINYGQAGADHQAEIALKLGKEYGVKVVVREFDYSRYYEGSKMPKVFVEGSVPQEHDRDHLTNNVNQLSEFEDFCWMEGRNSLFMHLAAIEAIYNGCNRLFTGFQYNEVELRLNDDPAISRGRDTTRHIMDTMNLVLFQGFSRPFRIEAPLMGMTKDEIMQYAVRVVPSDVLGRTHSCEYFPPCKKCSQCKETQWLRGAVCADHSV